MNVIISALISAVLGPIAILVVGYLLKRRNDDLQHLIMATQTSLASTDREIKATKYALTNEHTKHLRTDLDDKFKVHDEQNQRILSKLSAVLLTQNDMLDVQGDILQRQRGHSKDMHELSGSIKTIEESIEVLNGRVDDHDADLGNDKR